ncbi:MAG: glycosyltransferase [Planctomycetota bacterium]
MISSMDGGGSERQTLLLLQHLDRNRFDVHLYLKHFRGSLLDQVPHDVVVHAATDFGERNRVYWPGRIHRQAVDELTSLLKRLEIDVVYDRTYHMTLIAGPACEAASVPRVSTMVSPPSRAVPMVEKRFVEWKRKRLAQAYRTSRHVVTVSQQAADSAVTYYGLSADAIQVIPNPVDLTRLTHDANEARVDSATRSNRIRLVCVGRMTAEKGQGVLLDAVRRCETDWPSDTPGLEVRLVGDGALKRQLNAASESLTGRHRVVFVGHLDRPAGEIAAADALVLPSLFEGMPNVVLESMALGTPVIATRSGGTPEIERDEPIAFWAQPGDADSLANAIRRFASEPTMAKAHVEAAERVIRRHHSIGMTTHRISELLLDR